MKLIAYYHGIKKPGNSLDIQKSAVSDFKDRNGGKIISEYTESDSGKNSSWPKLHEAMEHAKRIGATLVIGKLDRLGRNVSFTCALMESGVEFIACDNATANRLTIHILATLAQTEAMATSRRTKDSLAAAKAKGTKLGSARPGHWKGRENRRGWKKGAKRSAEARSRRAMSAYAFLVPRMQEMKAAGDSYEKIAEKLTESGHQTTTGKPFTGTAVWRVMKRFEEATSAA